MENTIKTVLFLGLLTGLLLGIGSLFGTAGLVIGLAFALLINLVSYFWSDKLVLAMYRAKEAKEKDKPELYTMIKDITHLARIPMPKVYVIESTSPNAFATGRSPKHAAVAVTTGLMKLLDKEEMRGVLAHEVSHIKNRDILIATVAATIAGVISYLGTMAQFSAIFGGGDDDGQGNFVTLLVLAIITPIMAAMIQLAISRSREYQADESAARILGDGSGLVSALRKLESGVAAAPLDVGTEAGASLFIVNPFSMKGLTMLLSTHPTTEDRIKRLESLSL